jgi:putative transposase
MGSWRNLYTDSFSYFFTSSVVRSLPVLEPDEVKGELTELLSFYRKEYTVSVQGYVIMPDHLHVILNSEKGDSVKSFMQHFLKNSSKRIVSFLESITSGPSTNEVGNPFSREEAESFLNVFAACANGRAKHAVWKEKSRGIPIYSDRVLKTKLDYIHRNPLRKGLVRNLEDYVHSSYRNYYLDDHSVMEIDCVHCLIV